MDDKPDYSNADMRKSQEGLASMRASGYYKEVMKFNVDVFNEYVRLGMTRAEAMTLTLAFLGKGANE